MVRWKTLIYALSLPIMFHLPAQASSGPPAITWEWYNAGEAYKNYKPRASTDLAISARYHLRAAIKGNASSAYKLGEMYENGAGVRKNNRTALHWYGMAAKKGDKYAEFRVGWFYQHGLGTRRNLPEAIHWYRLAASHDNEWAYHMLAFMLADGQGMKRDRELAIDYFERSLPLTNDRWAKSKLATLIKSRDPVRAKRLLKEAAAAGNDEEEK